MKDSEIRQQLIRSGNVQPRQVVVLQHQIGKTERNRLNQQRRKQKKVAATK